MKNQSGNAVLFILVGIVLFAALSAAISQSSETGKGTRSDREGQEIRGVLEYFNQIKITTQNMVYSGRCKERDIRFWHVGRVNSGDAGHYGDGSNPRCQVFDSAGGGAPYKTRPESWASFDGSSEYPVISVRVSGIGQEDNTIDQNGDGASHELVIFVNVDEDTCVRANEFLNVPNPTNLPPAYTGASASVMDAALSPSNSFAAFPSSDTGGFSDDAILLGGASSAPEIANKSSACFSITDGSSTNYILYTVLLAR